MRTQGLRMILMGTGPFAVPSFEALRAAGHEIALVVTRPQPTVKSRKGPPASPVRDWAQSHQFELFDPTSINDSESVECLRRLNADLLVVCDYGQILKPEALETGRLGGINLHGSLLPKYRGAAPVQWSMILGDTIAGVTVIHMTPRLDGGPILATRQTPIREGETAGELEERLSRIGVDATNEAVDLLAKWDGQSAIGDPQDKHLATKAPRLSKSDGRIDWSKTARQIDCHVRGMQPWPVAFTQFEQSGKPPMRLAIKEISITDATSSGQTPGTLIAGDALSVTTGDWVVQIERLQPAGKKEMQGAEFLRGYQPAPGSRLG